MDTFHRLSGDSPRKSLETIRLRKIYSPENYIWKRLLKNSWVMVTRKDNYQLIKGHRCNYSRTISNQPVFFDLIKWRHSKISKKQLSWLNEGIQKFLKSSYQELYYKKYFYKNSFWNALVAKSHKKILLKETIQRDI